MARDELIETMARAMAPAFAEACSYWCVGLLWTACEYKDQCSCRRYAFDAATAVLTAIEAAGMRVVPVVATKAMLSVSYNDTETLDDTWRAMVLAAQEPTSG